MVNSIEKYKEFQIKDDEDGCPSYSKKTRFTVRDEWTITSNRLAAIVLGVLSVVFLFVVIGLGVHMNRVRDRHDILTFNTSVISSQLAQLQSEHRNLSASKNALQNKHNEDVKLIESLQKDLNKEINLKNELNAQKEKLEDDKRKLQSQISTQAKRNCGTCLPNWVQMNNTCLYFAVSSSNDWNKSRKDCQKKGADLVIIDSKEKQEFIIQTFKGSRYQMRFSYNNGFWIGLKDDHTEGVWKWLNETTMTEGYWMDGEPNDELSIEDCAAVYPTKNPMKAWNDVPCSHPLKWICEKELDETL